MRFPALTCLCVGTSHVLTLHGHASQDSGSAVQVDYDGEVRGHATMLLQTSLQLDTSTDHKAHRHTSSQVAEEQRAATPRNHSSQPQILVHNSVLAADARGTSVFDSRMRKLTHLAWLWSPFWVLAAAVTFLRQSSKEANFGSTAALTGFRAGCAVWITLEHVGFWPVAGSGAFVILAGAALSTSRRASPGMVKTPLNTVSGCAKFLFLRASRILPLYWFYVGCVEHLCFKSIDACTEEILRKSVFSFDIVDPLHDPRRIGIVDFFLEMPGNFISAWMNYPARMLLMIPASELNQLWFVQTVMLMYLFYPLLEYLAVGPKSEQPTSPSRLKLLLVICCAAKFLQGVFMLSVMNEFEGGSWYYWKGYSLYANPILRLPEFLMGIIVPHLAAPEGKGWIEWAPVCADILLVATGVLLVIMPWTWGSKLLTDINVEAPVLAFAMWGFCFGPERSPLGRLFSTKLFVRVGEWGYGVYIFHVEILVALDLFGYADDVPTGKWGGNLHHLTAKHWISIPILVLCFAKAWSSFVLIENPCGELARWLLGLVTKASEQLGTTPLPKAAAAADGIRPAYETS
mmetsp:Transcript_76582/g.144274  ORF Transcript_76582/g.144274 Transcript_76582/m.144274 type:complete len:573 (-) Transcript_76582:60-1778(-)